VSILSNHHPEVLDAMNAQVENPRECGPPTACTCPPAGVGVAEMCPACQAEYLLYRERVDAGLPLPGEEYERCGQQFSDGPLPDDAPF
jgi:hypothetical protein